MPTADQHVMPFRSKKLDKVFHGVAIASHWPDEAQLERLHHFTRPPSYLVALALAHLYGEALRRGHEKSEWAISLAFDGMTWLVSDWKRYACDIYGPEDAADPAGVLLKKLLTAATIVGNNVTVQANAYRDRDEISLENEYPRLDALHRFFRTGAEEAIEQLEAQPRVGGSGSKREGHPKVQQLAADLNSWFAVRAAIEKRAHANMVAAIVVFFAAIEAVLDAAFAIGDRQGRSFAAYRKLSWAERLKLWVDTSRGPTADTHRALIELRNEYRNTITHSSPRFLFPLSGPVCGLVPVDYEELYLPRATPWALRVPEEARGAFLTFDATLEMFRAHDVLSYALKYAESGLPIHINESFSEDLKRHMSSPEAFEAELNRRIDLQDRYDNMDI